MPAVALRITDVSRPDGPFRAEISFDNGQFVRTPATTEFTFSVSAGDQELVRWYWEDFLEYPDRVAQRKAARVERRMQEIGVELFQQVFSPSAAKLLWTDIQPRLAETRVEVVSSQLAPFSLLPWELMRDPKTGDILAEGCASFRRKPKGARIGSYFWQDSQGPLRVLLVMWQPPSDPQAPFRPSARRLLQGLSRESREKVAIDILRPPTFAQLNTVLLEAEALGRPYHVLQFDGYGVFVDAGAKGSSDNHFIRALQGPHGYLVSDNSTWERTQQSLDGISIGELMKESRVPLLVLNACRGSAGPDGEEEDAAGSVRKGCLEAFHSLGMDALSQGISGVLQMPYHLGSAASAQFLLKTYTKLAQGLSLSEAVSEHRKWLREQAERNPRGLPFLGFDLAEKKWQTSQPESELTFGWVRREDWLVPVVCESESFRLSQPDPEPDAVDPALAVEASSAPVVDTDETLPKHDAPGFFGREDILLTIDSLWQRHSVVLLHGDAAAGKTETAVEFARWYREVGGVKSTVLYTSFEHYKPLPALLDQLACVFAPVLRKADQQWESLDLNSRLELAFELLNNIPVLWIWDSVERLAVDSGDAAWREQEREEFVNFLRTAHETQAKFLLISRHEEKQWLRDLPFRFGIPPLPMRERLQLARALLEQRGLRLKNVEDWQAVLEFSDGNPLAIRFLAEQALAENLRTRAEITGFVERVRSSARGPDDGAGKDLAEPLRLTLRYIQQHSFNEGERKLLALLRLFRGRVSTELLAAMGSGDKNRLPELRELKEFQDLCSGAGTSVLSRAAAVGLLHQHEEGCYATHPALQWFFHEMFDDYYAAAERPARANQRGSLALGSSPETPAGFRGWALRKKDGEAAGRSFVEGLGSTFRSFGQSKTEDAATRAARAYVEAIGQLAARLTPPAENGDKAALRDLDAHESNLHHACRLACQLESWAMAAKATQGLGVLYASDGRLAQWESLLEQLTPLCVERSTQKSLPGREELWRVVIGQGARLAKKNRRLVRAEKMQELCVQWDREKAKVSLEKQPDTLETEERDSYRGLADSLYHLSSILREQGTPSIKVDEEAVALRERLGEKESASAWAYEIGESYTEVPEIRELSQAERWLKRGLDLKKEEDRAGRAKCLAQLGRIAWVRFNEARKAERSEAELRRYLNDARMYYQAALEHDPPDDHAKLAQHHEELGHISQAVGDFERALPHYRDAIRYYDLGGNLEAASAARFNLGIDLRNAGRFAEARKVALAAREGFQRLGKSESEMLQRTNSLLENIEQKLHTKKGLPAH